MEAVPGIEPAPRWNQVRHTETGEILDILSDRFVPIDDLLPCGIYEHYKSTAKDPKYYGVLQCVFDWQAGAVLVVYEPLYESDGRGCARPIEMFTDTVEHNGTTVNRFRYVSAQE